MREGTAAWGRLKLALVVPALVVAMAAPAHGRHNFSMLKVHPEVGMAGADVAVSGFSYPTNTKVSIRFDGLDGPVLAELEPTANQDVVGTVRIPEGTPSGRYVLFAVQYGANGRPNRIPGRAAVTVVGGGGSPPAVPTGLELERRPHALAGSSGASAGELVLVALGSFGLAAVVSVVLARVAVSRRPSDTEEKA
ncbi:MAG: hypothetical protein M3203_00510 [Actinomycetota bacterium]|nr:hypothetical protein [Actinomycetota bacterium]